MSDDPASDYPHAESLLYSRVFRASPSAVCISRANDATYVDVNEAFEQLTGYSRDELVGRSPFDLGIWEDPTVRRQFVDELARHGSLRDREAALRHRSGTVRWVSTSWEMVAVGQDQLVVGMMTDITARRQAQSELSLFFAHTPDLICIAGTDGYFKRVNPSFSRVLGHGEAELLAVPFIDFVHPEDAEATRTELARLGAGQVVTGFEHRFRRTDGAYTWLSWVAVPDTQANLVLAVGRDVTDQHEAHAALAQAKQEADRANRAKSEFLSRMSHELRTPLNVILGFGQILEMGPDLSVREAESVGHILKSGRHLLELIDEVLDISRIEAGHLSLSLEPVPLHDVVSNVVDLMRPSAAGRQISVNVDELSEALYVLADRSRLRQVLLNLVSNAIKYNVDGGSVVLRVRAENGHVRVEITDSGRGIPQRRLPQLFEPFQRLGAEMTDVQGTGLGLALCKSLMEAMEGQIGVNSVEGAGSTFWIDLPAAAPATVSDAPQGTGDTASATPDAWSERTVLYIEDNLANLKVVERLLEMTGAPQVLSALQGSLGIELAQTHRPDVIVLDLHLPDMTGEEVLNRLKGAQATQAIPVVVCSADASPGRIERLMEMGAHAYLPKPLDVREFLTTLEPLLR